jgi:hypothetical protein
LAHRLVAAELGKRVPGGGAGIRTERILCAGDVTQESVGSFLAAERAMGMTLWVSPGSGNLPALRHASQRRCPGVCNRERRPARRRRVAVTTGLDDGGWAR